MRYHVENENARERNREHGLEIKGIYVRKTEAIGEC